MADEQIVYAYDYSESPDDDRHDDDRRSLSAALAVVIVVVVLVIVFMMLRDQGSTVSYRSLGLGGRQIVPVEGGKPIDGAVSVWVAGGTDPRDALNSAGVNATEIVDMGGGRFVIAIPAGEEARSLRRLRNVKSIHDAGRVYNVDDAP